MAAMLDSQRLSSVFGSRPDLIEGIQSAADSPSRVKLFNEIAEFLCEQLGGSSAAEPALKRRRVDIEPSQNGKAASAPSKAATSASIEDVAAEDVLLEIKEISVSIPQRKKLDLVLTKQHIYARVPGTTAPLPGAVYAWKNIDFAFYLPVPEKTQVQYNYVLLPKGSCLPSRSTTTSDDPLLFTVPATAPKPGVIGGPNAAAAASVSDSYTTLFHWAFNRCLKAAGNNVQVIAADPAKFHSAVRQSHRPKEKAVHVKAFRGSKDGYLFFLENGILWGFKKPLMFMPLDRIAAISYTSVLNRTFNMVVEVFDGGDDGNDKESTDEIEFSMLDQEDYGGINESYVMRHGLQDRSMADQRKAKQELAENAKGKKGAAKADGDADAAADDDDMTELQKAQMEVEQQMQDDEDEDEEDYDPGSEGESEGEGTSSDEEDEDGQGGDGSDEEDGDDE